MVDKKKKKNKILIVFENKRKKKSDQIRFNDFFPKKTKEKIQFHVQAIVKNKDVVS